MKMRNVRVEFEWVPDHYSGDFPCVTIRYKDRDEAERLKSYIEEWQEGRAEE